MFSALPRLAPPALRFYAEISIDTMAPGESLTLKTPETPNLYLERDPNYPHLDLWNLSVPGQQSSDHFIRYSKRREPEDLNQFSSLNPRYTLVDGDTLVVNNALTVHFPPKSLNPLASLDLVGRLSNAIARWMIQYKPGPD
ncbi:MAG: hypothetical protein SFZ03_02160 [Candidatus Melainabacteria bacterium]|nr:hypothetical protein [Candidatus Melainabacteria bacterium]